MKKITLSLFTALFSITAFAQKDTAAVKLNLDSFLTTYNDSVEKTFTYQHGTILLSNGVGSILVPEGFKYMDGTQAEHVIVDLWGNPKGDNISLGLILPEHQTVMDDSGYVFNIQYDAIGFVKDDDADDTNYDELLEQMKKDATEENIERTKQGYPTIQIVGWAAKPFYDTERKILHWAKEIKFGSNEVNTLNYNIRVLGRKGVLVLNAISTMNDLPLVQKDIPKVLDIVKFSDGYQYKDFDSSLDEVAAWTIGGLVAGKILAKVGFFVLLLKFWKIIALAVGGFFSVIWKRIKGNKNSGGGDAGTDTKQLS